MQFIERLEQVMVSVRAAEKGFQIKYDDVPMVLMKQFPYHIHYVLAGDKIIVIAILHSHINPKSYP